VARSLHRARFMSNGDQPAVNAIRSAAVPLSGTDSDYNALLHRARTARLVLLGEASHGTHEFYDERAKISHRLIEELDFDAIVVEADWPDAYVVDQYVRDGTDSSPERALRGFKRFPQWMWRNDDVLALVDSLRIRNASYSSVEHAGFYGMDLYSLHASIDAVLDYLWKVDPDAARRARERYSCFEHFGDDPQAYGYATSRGADSCEDAVVRQLVELTHSARTRAGYVDPRAVDELFVAEQNARLVRNAERYYRAMFRGRASSWNLRDTHMADTVDALLAHLGRDGHQAKLIVWAHNSHLGDARATEMGARGEVNVGQLLRERHGDEVVSVGFTTHTGTVTAASDWDEPAETRSVVPSMAGSYERLCHEVAIDRFYLGLQDPVVRRALREPRLERAIGVIYRPETERQSHYFKALLCNQFDAIVHIDVTSAVRPLEETALHEEDEIPETFPTAL
jgi:erythromycin esterase-like protein